MVPSGTMVVYPRALLAAECVLHLSSLCAPRLLITHPLYCTRQYGDNILSGLQKEKVPVCFGPFIRDHTLLSLQAPSLSKSNSTHSSLSYAGCYRMRNSVV